MPAVYAVCCWSWPGKRKVPRISHILAIQVSSSGLQKGGQQIIICNKMTWIKGHPMTPFQWSLFYSRGASNPSNRRLHVQHIEYKRLSELKNEQIRGKSRHSADKRKAFKGTTNWSTNGIRQPPPRGMPYPDPPESGAEDVLPQNSFVPQITIAQLINWTLKLLASVATPVCEATLIFHN